MRSSPTGKQPLQDQIGFLDDDVTVPYRELELLRMMRPSKMTETPEETAALARL